MSTVVLAISCSQCRRLVSLRDPLQRRCTQCAKPFPDHAELVMSAAEAEQLMSGVVTRQLRSTEAALEKTRTELEQLQSAFAQLEAELEKLRAAQKAAAGPLGGTRGEPKKRAARKPKDDEDDDEDDDNSIDEAP